MNQNLQGFRSAWGKEKAERSRETPFIPHTQFPQQHLQGLQSPEELILGPRSLDSLSRAFYSGTLTSSTEQPSQPLHSN